MATITPVTPDNDGATVTFAAATSGGDTLATAGKRCVLLVHNAAGSSVTVTLAGAVECSQGSLHNQAVVCAVGDTDVDVPAHCVDPDGHVAITYSSATSVTVAAITK